MESTAERDPSKKNNKGIYIGSSDHTHTLYIHWKSVKAS